MNSHFGVTSYSPKCSIKNDRTNKRRKKKIKKRSSEDGYKSKLQKFLYPCKYPSNKHLRRRINKLERKVENFEKLYCNVLVNCVKDSKENKKTINNDEVTEVYRGRNEKRKVKIMRRVDGGSRLGYDKPKPYRPVLKPDSKENKKKIKNDDEVIEVYLGRNEKKNVKWRVDGRNRFEFEKSKPCGPRVKPELTKKRETLDQSKKQKHKEADIHFSNPVRRPTVERGSTKNRYNVSQIRELSPSAMEEEFSIDSIINDSDDTGKYYFVTSTAGYVKQYDETDSSSTPYEAAASIAKFTKKNLIYLFNQEILPRCIGTSSKNSNELKSNNTNTKTVMKKYASEKSTERTLIDKAVNTKERYFHVKEDSSPLPYPIDIVLTSKPDTFETDPPQSDMSDATKYEIISARMDSGNICITPYPVSSSCTSVSEISDFYISKKAMNK